MKKILLTLALAAGASVAFAQTTTTTTTSISSSGTIKSYTPGQTIVLTESAGPVNYSFSPTVTYVTRNGDVITSEQVARRVKVGIPVNVDYVKRDGQMVVERVILDE